MISGRHVDVICCPVPPRSWPWLIRVLDISVAKLGTGGQRGQRDSVALLGGIAGGSLCLCWAAVVGAQSEHEGSETGYRGGHNRIA